MGGEIQRFVHETLDFEDPKGWPSEISRGGEPTYLYSIIKTREVFSKNYSAQDSHIAQIDLSKSLGVTLGYYSSLQAGVSARIGKMQMPFWADYGPIYNRVPVAKAIGDNNSATNQTMQEKCYFERLMDCYFFVTGNLDIVLYNALLQGQFRHNDYEISSSEIVRAIPHVAVGFAFASKDFGVSVSYNFRGREIVGGKNHNWWSLSISCSY